MTNYPKIQKLGEGGFGEVWKVKRDLKCHTTWLSEPAPSLAFLTWLGWRTSTWHYAAMKIVKNPDSTAWSEVGLLIRSQHKNVIQYFDSYRDVNTGDLCIVMEYCDMGTLDNLIPQVSSLYL